MVQATIDNESTKVLPKRSVQIQHNTEVNNAEIVQCESQVKME